MDYNNELIVAIQKAAGTWLKDLVEFIPVTVVSVDEGAYTCVCKGLEDTDAQFEDVYLSAEPNDGLIQIPSVDSTVIVAQTRYNKTYVVMFSDITKVILVIGQSSLTITDGLFEFNGGDNFGMVLVSALVTKLNNLENKVNDLVTFTQTHTHTGVQTGGGTSGTTASPVTGTLTPTTRANIENTKITQ
jgi:GTP cyclohydrolase III